MPRRIKISSFARGTAVCKRTAAVGCSGSRYFIFRFEGVPININALYTWLVIDYRWFGEDIANFKIFKFTAL